KCISRPSPLPDLLHFFNGDRQFWVISHCAGPAIILDFEPLSDAFSRIFCRGQCHAAAGLWKRTESPQQEAQARNMKGRSLGERPAFLRSPPGCGVSKPWGVWEGGFDERLGGPPAGYVDLWCRARLGGKRCQSRGKSLSDMNFNKLHRLYAAN